MKTTLLEAYRKCRQSKPFMLVGQDAACSLAAAKTLIAFRQAEADGLVRMRAEEESESYLDCYGKPDAYTNTRGHEVSAEAALAELQETLEQHGCWCTVSEWFDGEDWQVADSCGMHTGYKNPLDPFENCYVIDEMQAALDALAAHVRTITHKPNTLTP